MLDMSSPNTNFQPLPDALSPEAAMMQLANAPLPQLDFSGMPPMAMPPMAFFQESLKDSSAAFRSAGPIEGCDCQCAQREAAMMSAQRNAMEMSEFPEEGEPVPWGQQE